MEKAINNIKIKQGNSKLSVNEIKAKKGYGEGDNTNFIKLVKKIKNDNTGTKKW